MMGATWISWRTTVTVITTLLHIQGLLSVTTTSVSGVEGQTLSFRCAYPQDYQNSVKYFYHTDDSASNTQLIRTDKHNQWEKNGRFSLYDNTTGAFVIISVDRLLLEDSGTYWCGVDISFLPDHISVIQLSVVQVTEEPVFPTDFTVEYVHKPLFLTAVMCVAAILFVCVFTLCLLLTVKHRRSGPRHNRQISTDYETMTPGVQTEPELCCNCPDCTELPALSLTPPDLCSNFKSKQRESTASLGIGVYVDVEAPESICQYQHLNVSCMQENVYHGLHENYGFKDETLTGVKEQTVDLTYKDLYSG